MNFFFPMTPATTGPRVDPDAHSQGASAGEPLRVEEVAHLERHLGDCVGVIRARPRNAADDHVRVADRLDLLEPVSIRDVVESGEDVVERGDQSSRRELGGEPGEADDVPEEDARVVEMIPRCDRAAP